MFTPTTLQGKNIVITGGGTGLGRAMALRFAALGAQVGICGRREDPLAETVATIEASAGQAAAFSCDIRDEAAVVEMLAFFRGRFGRVNGLVNNAAGNFLSASEDLTSGGFRAVVDIVLMGTFHCTHQFGRYWIEEQVRGTVLNIVTTYTETGCAFVLPSACAKAGVHALTTTLAYEWATYGIRLNALAPGPFPTEGAWSRLIPDERFNQLMHAGHPMGRVGEPEELTSAAVFLMSDLSTYINGAVLPVDGGERLQGAQFNTFAQQLARPELKNLFRSMRPNKKG